MREEMKVSGRVIIGDSRNMAELPDESVDLIITSPPYWHIKDYGVENQIGYGQTLHEYLKDLYRVWLECYRVLKEGRRICVNIGDQFARAVVYGRYKVIPLHSEVIAQMEKIGFDYMGAIIWQKKTTMNTTGGATVMGSYPYPPNGIVEIDYEYILIFKKGGKTPKVSKELKELSKMSKEEWKEYFSGHWNFGGAKQVEHEAVFPDELPRRLIKMFSFVGDTVLDPFLGSGTTLRVALELGRNAVGYEINKNFVEIIKKKLGLFVSNVEFVEQKEKLEEKKDVDYVPSIKDAKPIVEPKTFKFGNDRLYKIREVLDEKTLLLDTGLVVELLGVEIIDKESARNYLQGLKGKKVFLKFDSENSSVNGKVRAYVYLKNKIFINSYLIKSGMAKPDLESNYSLKSKFLKLWEN
jgi:DNA modification methylase